MLIIITSIILKCYEGGDDYDSRPYMLTIPAGMMRSSFDIAIINDNVVEGNEDFTLVINSFSLPVGSINEAMVTIVDDECK